MKPLIIVLIALTAVFVFTRVVGFVQRSSPTEPSGAGELTRSRPSQSGAPITGDSLPGLPPYLEASLAEAQQQGTEAFGAWLKNWQKHIQDPRLAWIELDYVVLLNLKDHKAARERFLQVQQRVPPTSPVYDRLAKLAPAYAQ